MTTDKQSNNSSKTAHLAPWQFKKGVSGNPAGRPPGKTLKEYSRNYLAGMTDEERDEFLEGLPKEAIWKMAEGNPDTKSDIKHELPDNLIGIIQHGATQPTKDTGVSEENSE